MYFMVHTFLQYIEVLGAVMGKYSIVLLYYTYNSADLQHIPDICTVLAEFRSIFAKYI